MIVVSNTSPLSNLAIIGQLSLLQQIYSKIIIPPAVYRELTNVDSVRSEITTLLTTEWIEVRPVINHDLVEILQSELDEGEAEAITLAIELKAERLLIDERLGRSVATRYGLRITGLLGVLTAAKVGGLMFRFLAWRLKQRGRSLQTKEKAIELAMKILVLNAGSSSQKSCLYQLTDSLPDLPPEPIWEAKVDWSHHPGVAELKVKTSQRTVQEDIQIDSRPAVIAHMLDTLWGRSTQVVDQPSEIDLVGHRVVHGGQEYQEITLVTPEVKATIARLAVLAPSHNPANLEGIEAIEKVLAVPQVAVFDTTFHSQLPQAAAVYPGPYEWYEQGIQRYGFHGISHQYCAERTAQILGQDLESLRLITCHLGNGCSLAAICQGQSVDTTMGFTPLEGLMMGSRSGSVDPGILLYLLQQDGCTADQLDQTLNKASGLKGISGLSSDMREISAAIAQGNSRAKLAFDIYVHRLRSQIGAMLASLGGLDALVFTAGVGENQPAVRAAACEAFTWLGLKLDLDKNAQSPADQDISMRDSKVRVVLVHTQEDWAIAKACWKFTKA